MKIEANLNILCCSQQTILGYIPVAVILLSNLGKMRGGCTILLHVCRTSVAKDLGSTWSLGFITNIFSHNTSNVIYRVQVLITMFLAQSVFREYVFHLPKGLARSVQCDFKEPRSIRSKPRAMAQSTTPLSTRIRAWYKAVDPVEQLLLTLIIGI